MKGPRSLRRTVFLLWIAALLIGSQEMPARADSASTARDGWNFNRSAEALDALCNATLSEAREAFSAIEADTGPATLQRVYGAMDALQIGLQPVNHIWFLKSVHPDPAVQSTAEACIARYTDFTVSTSLSRKFYTRVASIDLTDASASEKLMVKRRLRDFRKAGVDRDAPTQARVREMTSAMTALGTVFDRNIRNDRRSVSATPEELAGLPQDFLAAHPPDAAGIVHFSTDYSNYFPVMSYAQNDDLRRRMYIAGRNTATPANASILDALLRNRHELATLLGYKSYAAYDMDGLMVVSPRRAQDFLHRLEEAARAPAAREMATLLARLQRIDPQATQVQVWQVPWLSRLVQKEQYALDAREVREYFDFQRVQDGIFRLTEDLFGVRIVPWETDTWHPDVTAWEIREHGEPIGRFYLDLHPRENKYHHAAHWTLRKGLQGRQLPLSGVATNFPRGLMEHGQVETFLHEFGHLLHNMFSGSQQWLDIAGMSMEKDFVEAPSQMLEEWVWDYDTLRRFARNAEGEVIPAQLVGKMRRARHFGEALRTANQLFYANLALSYHNRDPESFELLPLMIELQARYSPYPYVPDTHFYNNFGHLSGYASNYYMYQWSRAIALDMLSHFRAQGMRNTRVAAEYRRKVLGSAGSRPAAEMVEDFLGRPFSPATYTQYLNLLN